MLAATAPVSLAAAMLEFLPVAWAYILFCNGGVLTTYMLMVIAVTPLSMNIALFESAEAMPMPVILVLTVCRAIVTSQDPQTATI